MVILENIRLTKEGIECEYNPEKSGRVGHISLSKDGKADVEYSDYEYGKQTYAQKVIHKLTALLEDADNIPTRTAVTWY